MSLTGVGALTRAFGFKEEDITEFTTPVAQNGFELLLSKFPNFLDPFLSSILNNMNQVFSLRSCLLKTR
jgi:hypothetical protein